MVMVKTERTRKSSVKQNSQLLHFLHQSQTQDIRSLEVNIVLLIINMIMVHWSWGSSQYLNLWPALVVTNQIFYGCAAITSLIIIQAIIGVIYDKQLFFQIQAKIFRFCLLHLMISYCLQNIAISHSSLYLGILIILIIVGILTNYYICRESAEQTSLIIQETPRTVWLLGIQIAICLVQCLENDTLIKLFLLVSLFLVLFLRLKEYLYKIIQTNMEFKVYSFILDTHNFLICCILYLRLSEIKSPSLSYVATMLLGLIFLFVSGYLKIYRIPWVLYYKEENIHSHFNEFVQMAQVAIEQPEDKTFKKDHFPCMIIAYTYSHPKICGDPQCPLRMELDQVPIAEYLTETAGSRLISRFLKKMDCIFQAYQKENPQEISSFVSHIKLVLLYSRYKGKGLEIISNIEGMTSNFKEDLIALGIRKQVDSLDCGLMDTGQESKVQEDIDQFRYDLYFTLTLMMDFWSQFFEQRVDLNKLVSISMKLFPFRQEIEYLWQKIIMYQSFSTAHIMITYAQYVRMILNDEEFAEKIEQDAQRMKCRLRDDKTVRLREHEETGVVILSLNDTTLGQIKQINEFASHIFGYTRKDAIKRRINDLMPKPFTDNHDMYLHKFRLNRNKHVNTDQRVLVGKHRNKFIIPIKLQLRRQFSSFNDDILFMACINPVKFRRPETLCIVDEQGNIIEMSSQFKQIFKLDQSGNCVESIIKNFWSLISNEIKMNNQFLLSVPLTTWGMSNYICNFYTTTLSFQEEEISGYLLRGELIKNPKNEPVQEESVDDDTYFKFELAENGFVGRHALKTEMKQEFNFTMSLEPSKLQRNINSSFRNPETKLDYGHGIRIFRLIDNQMFRNDDEFPPNWDDYDFQGPDNNSYEKQQLLNSVKEGSLKNRSQLAMVLIRYMTHIFSIVLISLLIFNFTEQLKEGESEKHQINRNEYITNIQTLTGQLVTRLALSSESNDTKMYGMPIKVIASQLTDSVNSIQMDPSKKERLMKLTYLLKKDNITEIATSEVVQIPQNQRQFPIPAINICIFIIFPLLILSILLYEKIYQFLQTQIFSVFLELDQRLIKRIFKKCSQFIKKIENQTQRSDDVSIVIDEGPEEESSNNSQNKTKKLKNQASISKVLLTKVFVVLLFISVLLFSYELVLENYDRKIEDSHKALLLFEGLRSTTAVLLMKIVLSKENLLFDLSDDFFQKNTKFDSSLYELYDTMDPQILKTIKQTLYTDICAIDSRLEGSCRTLFGGVMQLGASQGINYLMVQAIKIYHEKVYPDEERLRNLLDLWFLHVRPKIQALDSILNKGLSMEIKSHENFVNIVFFILVFIVLCGDYLICRFVIRRMETELHLTRQLITLIPDMTVINSQGYSSLPQN